jgi:hypothetical protein
VGNPGFTIVLVALGALVVGTIALVDPGSLRVGSADAVGCENSVPLQTGLIRDAIRVLKPDTPRRRLDQRKSPRASALFSRDTSWHDV